MLPGVPVPDVALDLLEALIQFLDTHPTLPGMFGSSANTPKFFSDEAPIGTALPYLVIYDNDDETMDNFMSKKDDGTTPYLTDLDLQISVFDTSKYNARSLAWYVVDAINDSTITFTRGTLIHFRMVRQRTDLDPEPGPNGTNVWQRTLFVHAVVQRTL